MTEKSEALGIQPPPFSDRWTAVKLDVRRFLLRRGVSHEDSDDLLQDVAFKLWREADNLPTDMEHFRAIAFTTAGWAVVNRARTRARREVAMDPWMIEEQAASHTPDLAAGIIFRQAWQHLSKREQQVLELHHQGQPDIDIAAALGISAATVRSVARRARAKAADFL